MSIKFLEHLRYESEGKEKLYKIDIDNIDYKIQCIIKFIDDDLKKPFFRFTIPNDVFFKYEKDIYLKLPNIFDFNQEGLNEKIFISELQFKIKEFLDKNSFKYSKSDFLYKFNTTKNQIIFLTFSLIIAIILRFYVSLGKYSGFSNSPNFGDYEAQRHWMELTINTPPKEWYIETPNNNLSEWRLDYPPLTAYHSLIIGFITKNIEPKSMELKLSRGYETYTHKKIMRASVLMSDLIFIFGLVVLILFGFKHNFAVKNCIILLGFITPGFILIDHGHFQYNCVMHGLVLFGAYFCSKDKFFIGSIFFVLGLNFKQMALYFALPFFFFILGRIFYLSRNQSSQKIYFFFYNLALTGLSVLGTMLILWLPWLDSIESASNVLKAIFPVQRGLYQLQVSSFWYISNSIIQWRNRFGIDSLFLFALILTVLTSIPSNLMLLIKPRKSIFFLTLLTTSLSFFLFSFHVHEKTILIPLLALIFNIKYFNMYFFDFVIVSTLTLNQLIVTYDDLEYEYSVCNFTFLFGGSIILFILKKMMAFKENYDDNFVGFIIKIIDLIYFKIVRFLFIGLTIFLTIYKNFQSIKHPTLWPFMCANLGFCMFFLVFFRGNLIILYKLIGKKKLKLKKN